MLLDDDPSALIQECIDNFNISSDRAALTRIGTSLSSLAQTRDAQLGAQQAALKRLARQQHTLEQQHSLHLASHNPAEHAASILALDSRKFRVAKEASDLEIEGERLDGELAGLGRQLRDADAGGADDWAAGRRDAALQDVLKLKLYRSMGIDLEADAAGAFTRAVVRSRQRRDATLIDIDARLPAGHYVNRFWDAI